MRQHTPEVSHGKAERYEAAVCCELVCCEVNSCDVAADGVEDLIVAKGPPARHGPPRASGGIPPRGYSSGRLAGRQRDRATRIAPEGKRAGAPRAIVDLPRARCVATCRAETRLSYSCERKTPARRRDRLCPERQPVAGPAISKSRLRPWEKRQRRIAGSVPLHLAGAAVRAPPPRSRTDRFPFCGAGPKTSPRSPPPTAQPSTTASTTMTHTPLGSTETRSERHWRPNVTVANAGANPR